MGRSHWHEGGVNQLNMSKGGRPTKYSPQFCSDLIDHMAQGMSFQSFAGVKGVNIDTLYEWSNANSQFSDAKKIGLERNRVFWEKVGIAGMMGKIKNFNATVYIFNKKNRFPKEWRDRQEVQQVNTISPVVIELDDGKQIRLEMKENQIE